MNQRSTTLQEDLQWYRSQRDLAWAQRDGLQRELELTLEQLDDAQTEIGEQMARSDRLQRALNGYDDEDHRYRKRPQGNYSSTGVELPLGTRRSTTDILPMQDATKIEVVPLNNGLHLRWRKTNPVQLPA